MGRRKQLGDAPVFTNAHINRKFAMRMFRAGLTPSEVARAFPEVFKTSFEGGAEKLGLRYDGEYSNGLFETSRLILDHAFRGELRNRLADLRESARWHGASPHYVDRDMAREATAAADLISAELNREGL